MREKEMESDLPFIEIAEEDDSLLRQIYNDDGLRLHNDEKSTSNDNHYTCSPLLTVRSSVSDMDSCVAFPSGRFAENHSPLISSNHMNKDATNANKLEYSNFSIEPQQMKRKRKGPGYNLRKSLAWNRAFFTEEGVLNPFELSMISSNTSSSSGKRLSGIHEEETGSSYGDLDRLSDSADSHSMEEMLCKELPTNTPNKDGKIGCDLVHASSTKENAKHKVLAVQDTNRSGSKRSGCPRPLAPSFVKRPTTTSTTRAANNEANFSRIPICKHDPSLLRRTVKRANNASESGSKINQAARQAVNQKSMMTKSSTINTKSVLNKAKAAISSKPVTAKTSIQEARRNVTDSLTKKESSILHRQSSAKEYLGIGAMQKSSACQSDQDGHNKVAVSAKPSGLRMPSPSLQFFSQSKVAAVHSPLQRNDQFKKYGMSNFSNARTLEPRFPPVPKKLPKLANGEAKRINIPVCPSTGHLEGVKVTSSDVCLRSNDSTVHELENPEFISWPSPGLQIGDVLEDVTSNSMVDSTPDIAKDVKCIPAGDNLSGSSECRQVGETCYSHTISEIKHENPQGFQNNNLELDRTTENQIENAASNFEIPDVCSKTRELSHGDMDYPRITLHLGAELQQENLHPEVYIGFSQLDTSLKQNVKSYGTDHDSNDYSVRHRSMVKKVLTVDKFSTENQHSEANHHLFERAEFSEGLQRLNGDAAEVNSMAIGFYRSGLESHDHRFQDNQENESNCEVAELSDFVQDDHLYPMIVNDSSPQPNVLKRPNSLLEVGIILGNDHESCLNDELLPTTTRSTPTVCSDEKILVSFTEPSSVYESGNPNDLTRTSSTQEYLARHKRKIVEQTSVEEVISGPLASATVQNFDSSLKIVSIHDDVPREETALESESSVTVSNNITSDTTIISKPTTSCSLSNEHGLSVDSILTKRTILRRSSETNERKSPIAAKDDNKTTTSQIDATFDGSVLHESHIAACSTEDKDTNLHIKKSMEDAKHDTFLMKPPPSAAPFSEEWLAAFEAAGEEILTKKSGAVQNSPPDKPLPEPGPWSPVRRKNNQGIGPYDCTKYTNTTLPPGSQ